MSYSVHFYKLQGTGNDFIFILDKDFPDIDRTRWVQSVCQRKVSIGADGVAFIKDLGTKNNIAVLEWDFYNDNGSKAEMCGNAARCSALFAKTVLGIDTFLLKTLSGTLEVSSDPVPKVKTLTPEFIVQPKQVLVRNNKKIDGFFVNTGVPHFTVLVDDVNQFSRDLCLEIQMHSDFGPDHTNVTLFQNRRPHPILVKSFERGVEDFTLSCGTGAMAVAATMRFLENQMEFAMEFPGGPLEVRFETGSTLLTGPSTIVFHGHVEVPL